jgi:PAS domain S-box-containing protein
MPRSRHRYLIDVEPLRDADGAVVGGVSFWRDITTRAQLLEELGQQRRLLDLAHDAIIVRDPIGSTVTYWNREAEELFGYTREELIGQPVETLLPRGLRKRHEAHRNEFLANPRARPMGAGLDLLARRRGGNEFLVEISLSPLQTDNGMLISASRPYAWSR